MNQQANQQKKSKGPIRFEAIIPFLIVVALIMTYFIFFFDTHLKWGIEYSATRVNGAEVNVGSVKTSFVKGSFALNDLQVTDVVNPEKNVVQVGQVHFQFLWDALLRMKFVVDDASITNFQVNTPRKKAGYVLPVEEPLSPAQGEPQPGALDGAAQMLSQNVDMGQLNEIKLENSKALAKIEELKSVLPNKQTEWKQTVETMPGPKEFQALQTKISQLKIGGTSNPAEIQSQIQQAQSVINETNEKSNQLKSKVEFLNQDISQFAGDVKSIDQLIQQDIRDVESKLKLPTLDTEGLAASLFGPEFVTKLKKYKRYALLAKKHMPAKKKSAETLTPRERAQGVNIEFSITTGYPMFWLKRASLSSKADGSPFGGDVAGEILDVTTNPPMIGKPTIVNLKADFEKADVRDIMAKLVLDHTKEVAKQNLTASVGGFTVQGKMFSQSDSAKLGFNTARGSSQLNASASGEQIQLHLKSAFTQVDYVVDSNNQQLKEILVAVVKDIPIVTLDAEAKGSWDNMQWNIQSNLAGGLQNGFQKQLKGKFDEARNKIKEAVESKVGKQKNELNSQFQSAQAPVQEQVKSREKELQNVQASAQGKLKEAQNQATSQGTKALDDLKKKIGF